MRANYLSFQQLVMGSGKVSVAPWKAKAVALWTGQRPFFNRKYSALLDGTQSEVKCTATLYLPSTWMEPGTMLTLMVLLGLEMALARASETSSEVGSCAGSTELLNWSLTSATVLFVLPLLAAGLHPKKTHFSVNTYTSYQLCKCIIVPSCHYLCHSSISISMTTTTQVSWTLKLENLTQSAQQKCHWKRSQMQQSRWNHTVGGKQIPKSMYRTQMKHKCKPWKKSFQHFTHELYHCCLKTPKLCAVSISQFWHKLFL